MVTEATVVTPKEATQEDLLFVHTPEYLNNLRVNIIPVNLWELLGGRSPPYQLF